MITDHAEAIVVVLRHVVASWPDPTLEWGRACRDGRRSNYYRRRWTTYLIDLRAKRGLTRKGRLTAPGARNHGGVFVLFQ